MLLTLTYCIGICVTREHTPAFKCYRDTEALTPLHSLPSAVQALDRFRATDNAVLVATDVAARGLDIKDVR